MNNDPPWGIDWLQGGIFYDTNTRCVMEWKADWNGLSYQGRAILQGPMQLQNSGQTDLPTCGLMR